MDTTPRYGMVALRHAASGIYSLCLATGALLALLAVTAQRVARYASARTQPKTKALATSANARQARQRPRVIIEMGDYND